MKRQKLYCPPSGEFPQELPDYWKFNESLVRTDLQSLSDEYLNKLGWDGPFYCPFPKQTISDRSAQIDEVKSELTNNPDYIFDDKNNVWVTTNHDYDPQTHKVIWYSKERKFLVVPNDSENLNYNLEPIPNSTIIPESTPTVYEPRNIIGRINLDSTSNNPACWGIFKTELMKSSDFNFYVSSIMQQMPIVATSLPIAITSLEYESYDNFISVWKILNESENPPSQELKNKLIELSEFCFLPSNFINIIKTY